MMKVMMMTVIQDFVLEDVEHHKGQRENFLGGVGPSGAAKV
jgi:hypothetical protein